MKNEEYPFNPRFKFVTTSITHFLCSKWFEVRSLGSLSSVIGPVRT